MTDWRPEFENAGAVYERPPVTGAPHIDTIKSDTHTTAYFNSDYAEQYAGMMDEIGEEWAAVLAENGLVPDRVVGHAPFAVAPAMSLTRALNGRDFGTLFGYARLGAQGLYTTSFPIRQGEKVVVVADDVVSGASTIKTAQDIEAKGGLIVPVIPCLANLSLSTELSRGPGREGLPFLAASTFEPTVYRTRETSCELCAVGSVALAPRAGNNWQELQSWMR